MWLLTIVLSIFFSVFSTVVMSYLAMAIPIGPWIAPTLALIGMLVFSFFKMDKTKKISKIALATSAGSVGGILANAVAFYFPTLYFLDKNLFDAWMVQPFYFSAVVTALGFVSGWFGLWIANLLEDKFVVQEKLAFPIGQLVHKTIIAQGQVEKAFELVVGFFSTTAFCFLQDGLFGFKFSNLLSWLTIPKSVTLLCPRLISVFKIPAVKLDMWPMLWALGFVTGHVIAFPLAVGLGAKILLVGPLNKLAFSAIPSLQFILTFSSGMVLFGAVFGLIATPKVLWKAIKNILHNGLGTASKDSKKNKKKIGYVNIVEFFLLLIPMISFLTYFGFSLISQLYLIVFAFVCAYQIANIAGKIGLAFMGRFATFVMVPAIFLFRLDVIQIVVVVTFVGVCGGVATDVLFGRKLARLAGISSIKIKTYQYLGLIVSSLCVGFVFWLLINHFGLGSQDLFAYRAQNRWLLIRTLNDAKSFNVYVLLLGFLFGYLLKKLKVSPMLALGGLFMPVNITLGLVLGGFGAMLTKNKEEWFPFWSGVYAANSVWMLLKAIF
ncbi:OPT/YSL family transporter [bacterium]|nr:OPT/YSL family transporter [bacterium]